jgi:biofilm PGA synthesis N-glycosyltransferase PgaC
LTGIFSITNTSWLAISFWISLFIVFYTYLGYGILLYWLLIIRRIFKGRRKVPQSSVYPTCTLLIAAYNEEDFILEKIRNTLALEYPKDKLELLFITDGSDDGTPEILAGFPEITLLHQPKRMGKVDALHRAMEHIKTEIVIFTDANTILNKNALTNIARHYQDRSIGAVAGEKRIETDLEADAGTAGEGFYWRYESTLKKWDSELYTVVGAAGELFSIRTDLYQPVSNDTILDDFMISMLIAKKGYRIIYEPDAYAIETASENITEELKRKIRIAAGGIQSVIRLGALLNVFKYGTLSFQYISHRVLRWTLTPFFLIAVFILNLFLLSPDRDGLYLALFTGQILFYLLALSGFIFENKKLRIRVLFIPFYFCVMNYAVLAGLLRYYKGEQSAAWEKAKRK